MRRSLADVLWIFVLSALVALGWAILHPLPAWNETHVPLERALAWGDKVLWVDARSDKVYAEAHIPGALSLNDENFLRQLPAVKSAWTPGRRVIVYCSSQKCGAAYAMAERLQATTGWPDIYVLQGGWEAWQTHLAGK